ncbi:16S rRNA (cytosine(967)-C(5))-methyltransferase RsmB [Fictibacillus aquaticus]|uniref:16S rRNA (cytosine(967)-C(5))-methyltransferase n=1 Tax=Fictibacillus aquaticus TaxID=2021314 RepID=A0A235FFM6_9BACL|nr:16S rRNA (cytosine(967)-C(5))-methyltransferase RsmB [Fictibacillus aquaticus]OYD59803.1 16S rRNA (cytosine(967)-C(5))-methyltransferase [Fictibacillus aquaticus]
MNKTKKKTVRQLAFEILLKIEQNQAYSNLLIHQELQKSGMDERDKGLLTNLVYGTVQRKNTLDFYIDPFLKKELKKKDNWIRVLLRMSVFQFLYMDRVPDHAIINESVTIAKMKGHSGIGGLVNGVLRSIQREGVRSTESIEDETKRLALHFSTPEWMIEKWSSQYGAETAALMAESNLSPAPVTARVNVLKCSRDEAIAALEAEGITAVKGELSEDSIMAEKGFLPGSSAYKDGLLTIQDESSMLVARALAPEPGEQILDACAAPGGKTTHLAEQMNNQGDITALDLHPHKIKLIKEQAERLGLHNIHAEALDARKAREKYSEEYFDRILADVPCSGYGVIRKKPDMKWTKSESDAARLSSIQKEIVASLVPLLKDGGVFVYSTCTIDKEENEEMASWILKEFSDLQYDPTFKDKMPETVQAYIADNESQLQILPHYFNSDGFFIAAFRKTKKQTAGGETDA